MRQKKTIAVILITSAVWLLGLGGTAFYFQPRVQVSNIGSMATVYRASRDLQVGDVLSTANMVQGKVNPDEVVSGAVQDARLLLGQKVISPIKKNEQIVGSRLVTGKMDIKKDYKLYTISVNVNSTNANDIQALDYVDVRVSYKDSKPSDVVKAKIMVYDIRTSQGQTLNNGDKQAAPAFVTFLLSENDIRLLDQAQKDGTIFLTKYLDTSGDPSNETYKPAWASGQAQQTQPQAVQAAPQQATTEKPSNQKDLESLYNQQQKSTLTTPASGQ